MQSATEFDAWRLRARQLLAAGSAPEAVHWDDTMQATLLENRGPAQLIPMRSGPSAAERAGDIVPTAPIRIPSRLLKLFEACACHSDSRRLALMYRLLWRATHGERELLDDAAGEDVRTLTQMAKSVDRDCHKMHAYVRFRELPSPATTDVHFVASYRPQHHILRRASPFFVKRFGTMVWTIVTPDGAAHWNRVRLSFVPLDPALTLQAADATEALWLTYYESIFNPARLNVRAMQQHMPQKYWSNLPEAARIPALIANANSRAGRMVETVSLREVPFRGCPTRPARELSPD